MLLWSSRQLSWRSSWQFLSLTLSPLCAHLWESLPLGCWSKSQNWIEICKLFYSKGFKYFYSTVHFFFCNFCQKPSTLKIALHTCSHYFPFPLLLPFLDVICNKTLTYVCMYVTMMLFVEISPCRIRTLMTTFLTLAVCPHWTGQGRRGSWPSRLNPKLQSSKHHR